MSYRWTIKDLADLEAFYWNEVAPTMREDSLDPETDYPPYKWMAEHGFTGFIKALRRVVSAKDFVGAICPTINQVR
jgi:hypothetical protein